MDIAKLKTIINKIKNQSKEQARVDTGFLKRSIYGVVNEKGIAEFGEVFYGQFGENSFLEENINKYFPKELPFKLIYYDEDGLEYTAKKRTVSGRNIKNNLPLKKIETKPTASKNIRNLIKSINDKQIKEDGKEINRKRKG